MDIGSGELFLILFLALLVYGGRLPEVALAVGRTIGGLKRTLQETTDLIRAEAELGLDDVMDEDDEPRVVRRAQALDTDEEPDEEDVAYDEFGVALEEDPELATEDVSGEDLSAYDDPDEDEAAPTKPPD